MSCTQRRCARHHIADTEDFRASALSAAWEVPQHFLHGRLTDEDLAEWRALCDHVHGDQQVYVIRSYVTPIAWDGPDGWHIVTEGFSVTTRVHKAIIRDALAQTTARNIWEVA